MKFNSMTFYTEDDYMNYLKESENAEQVSEEPVEETTEE